MSTRSREPSKQFEPPRIVHKQRLKVALVENGRQLDFMLPIGTNKGHDMSNDTQP